MPCSYHARSPGSLHTQNRALRYYFFYYTHILYGIQGNMPHRRILILLSPYSTLKHKVQNNDNKIAVNRSLFLPLLNAHCYNLCCSYINNVELTMLLLYKHNIYTPKILWCVSYVMRSSKMNLVMSGSIKFLVL